MKNLLLLGGLLGSCSVLKPPSAAQLIAGEQAASKQVATRPPGIYDGLPVSRTKTIPLVFVDERKYRFSKRENLAPNSIDSIRIIKPAVGIAIYGKKARHGLILITTKKEHR